MFCYNLCSWFIKNIVFSLSAREIISPIMSSSQTNFYPLISLFFVLNLKVYNVDFLYLVLTKSRQFRWSHWMQRQMSGRLRLTVSCYKTSSDEGRSEPCGQPNGQPGNRTVAAKCFTRKPPSICSIDTYVDLRGDYKNVLFEERGGGKGWSKITSRPTHTPLFFTQGYAREKKKKAGEEQTNKGDNQPVRS